MAPLNDLGMATLQFQGTQGSPAYCGLLFHPRGNTDREEATAALLSWWQAYMVTLAPFIVSEVDFFLATDVQWLDPATGEIEEDAVLPPGARQDTGTGLDSALSRACGIRQAGTSAERVNNRRVRTGFVIPYIAQNSIDDEGQVAAGARVGLRINLDGSDEGDAFNWAAWHRPVYERDEEDNRVLVEPGIAYTAGGALAVRPYVSMLRSRRD